MVDDDGHIEITIAELLKSETILQEFFGKWHLGDNINASKPIQGAFLNWGEKSFKKFFSTPLRRNGTVGDFTHFLQGDRKLFLIRFYGTIMTAKIFRLLLRYPLQTKAIQIHEEKK